MNKNYNLFMDEYAYRGYQADYAKKLSENEIDTESKTKIYRTTVELFMAAVLIGCYNNKKIEKAKGEQTRKIFQQAFQNHDRDLRFIYRLVMLSNVEIADSEERISAAFKNLNEEKYWNLFEQYMLGGLEILHSHFFGGTENKTSKEDFDDYFEKLFALLIEFKETTLKNNEDEKLFE